MDAFVEFPIALKLFQTSLWFLSKFGDYYKIILLKGPFLTQFYCAKSPFWIWLMHHYWQAMECRKQSSRREKETLYFLTEIWPLQKLVVPETP